MGAGQPRRDGDPEPRIVVVATPPDVAAQVVVRELAAHPEAVVTDVASVKERVAAEVRDQAGARASRYVGSHPMAGRERSGAVAADSDLFAGRPWVIVGEGAQPAAELAVRSLAVVTNFFVFSVIMKLLICSYPHPRPIKEDINISISSSSFSSSLVR